MYIMTFKIMRFEYCRTKEESRVERQQDTMVSVKERKVGAKRQTTEPKVLYIGDSKH